MKELLVPLLALLAFASSACRAALDKSREEFHLRFVAAEDAFELVELQYGIDMGDDVQNTRKQLDAAFQGAREFPIDGGFITFDVDAWVLHAREKGPDQRTKHEHRLLELEGAIRVAQSEFFEDHEGRLGLLRRWRIVRGTEVVRLLDDWFRDSMRKRPPVFAPNAPGFPAYDRETEELWRRRLDSEDRILDVRDGTIVLDLPMSARGAARWTIDLLDQKDEVMAELLRAMTSFEIGDGRMKLTFGSDTGVWTRWLGKDDGRAECPKIRALIASLGHPIHPLDAVAAARIIGLERLPPARSKRAR